MRPSPVRLIVIAALLIAAVGMSAAAGQVPSARLLTATPAREGDAPTPTPTAARERPNVPPAPTVIEPGHVYEGNLFGTTATFLLNGELGQFFILELTTDDFDAVLEILDSNGNQVARDDDSGSGNMPQLFFIAPSTDQFSVIVRGYSDPVEGSYVLRVNNEIEALEFGVPVVVTMDGEASTIYTFEAERGDVINLSASSGDTIDTTLRLLGPDNYEIGYVDDFSGIDPEFRRLPLTADGRYFAIHGPYSTSAIGDVTLLLEKTELSFLTSEPVEINVTEYSMKDIYNIEVAEGSLYLVTVSTSAVASGSLDITDLDGSNYGSATFNNSEGATMFFRPTTSGTLRLTFSVNNSTSPKPINVFVSVRNAEQ